jgi:hypothetical protein
MENNDLSNQLPQWTENFFRLIHKNWSYHSPCEHINIQGWWDTEEKIWQIKAAPVFQEVYGGGEDGKKVWAGFIFDSGDFGRENGVWIQEQAVASYCQGGVQVCNPHPKLMIRGKYKNHWFLLHIHLEPITETETIEVVDTIKKEVRAIPPAAKEE